MTKITTEITAKLLLTIAISVLFTGGIAGCTTDTLGPGTYSVDSEYESRYHVDRFNRNYYGGYSRYRGYSGYRGYRDHGFGHYRSRHQSYGGYSRHGYRSYRRGY